MSTPVDQLPELTVTAQRLSTLNNAQAVSVGRRPRGIVQLGLTGALKTVPGWVSWSVSNNSYYEADTFKIVFAASALPPSNDANWFSDQKEMFASIYGGFPQDPANPQTAELVNWIYGRVDDIAFNPKSAEITLTGRDLTAVFIDSRISSEFQNQTSSQIATLLAKKHGLDTSHIEATTTKVGVFFNNDQVEIAANRSEWDLLAFLAREEGFVVFVSGQSLFFQADPRPTGASDPYLIKWTPPTTTNGSPVSNAVELNFSRSLTVAKGISVTARSPNRSTGRAVVQSYPTTPKEIGAGKSSPFGPTTQYFVMMAANKTPTEVAAFAQQTYRDIIAHEMKMTAYMPADDLLTVSTPVIVSGTGTSFDQLYFPRLVTREMSNEEGYRMTIEAQNTNPDQNPIQ
jgi:phage protein D